MYKQLRFFAALFVVSHQYAAERVDIAAHITYADKVAIQKNVERGNGEGNFEIWSVVHERSLLAELEDDKLQQSKKQGVPQAFKQKGAKRLEDEKKLAVLLVEKHRQRIKKENSFFVSARRSTKQITNQKKENGRNRLRCSNMLVRHNHKRK